jgi:hypothetical protein
MALFGTPIALDVASAEFVENLAEIVPAAELSYS